MHQYWLVDILSAKHIKWVNYAVASKVMTRCSDFRHCAALQADTGSQWKIRNSPENFVVKSPKCLTSTTQITDWHHLDTGLGYVLVAGEKIEYHSSSQVVLAENSGQHFQKDVGIDRYFRLN